MAKLTQKAKLCEAISFAYRIKGQANYLLYVSDDDDYKEGQKVAKELEKLVKEFLNLMK